MTEGTISLALADSTAPRADPPYPTGAPNVVVIVLDDLGFAQLGCYGSDIDTPNIDRLAERGVRFTNFHTTAVCSPTRACLLTGRNHHRVGMGMLPDMPVNYPGYTGQFPDDAATLPEILRGRGWSTTAVGKWHLVPRDQRATGPFRMWPTGVGFERYYGFLNGETNQWTPNLVRDQQHVEPPATPEEGYHLDADLADEAVRQLRDLHVHDPDRPFLLWYATGSPHAPHQAPAEWIDRYRGRFDDGWDVWRERVFARQKELGVVPADAVLSVRPDWVEPWDDIDDDRRRLYTRMMEVYAGFLSHTDHHIGRVLDTLEDLGRADDTIVMLVSDNGASGEGGPNGSWNQLRHYVSDEPDDLADELAHYDDLGGWHSNGHYPWGWAHAGNTPFRRWKRYTFEGGVRDPLIVSWPAGLDDLGSVRDQYVHAVDVPVTVLDLLGIEPPDEVAGTEQLSYDGVPFTSVLHDAAGAEVRTSQYYECWGSRAIYADGWKAVTDHVNQLTANERELMQGSDDFDRDRWHLFHVAEDFSENHDLADERPDKLAELQARWAAEADRNQVLPIDDSRDNRVAQMHLPWWTYRPSLRLAPGDKVHEVNTPLLSGGFRMTARFDEPLTVDATGVLCEQGDRLAGWAWLFADGQMVWSLGVAGEEHRLATAIPVGARFLTVDGAGAGGGLDLVVHADGHEAIASASFPASIPMPLSPDGTFLTVGYGRPFPVSEAYVPPSPAPSSFVAVDLVGGPPPVYDPDELMAQVLRHQ